MTPQPLPTCQTPRPSLTLARLSSFQPRPSTAIQTASSLPTSEPLVFFRAMILFKETLLLMVFLLWCPMELLGIKFPRLDSESNKVRSCLSKVSFLSCSQILLGGFRKSYEFMGSWKLRVIKCFFVFLFFLMFKFYSGHWSQRDNS